MKRFMCLLTLLSLSAALPLLANKNKYKSNYEGNYYHDETEEDEDDVWNSKPSSRGSDSEPEPEDDSSCCGEDDK